MKHWIQAARLRTLPLSVSGIIVGSFYAMSQALFNWSVLILALLTTLGFQVLSNFANDYGDGIKGTDNEDRVGPKRTIQSGLITPQQMKKALIITSLLTLLSAIALIYVAFKDHNLLFSFIYLFHKQASTTCHHRNKFCLALKICHTQQLGYSAPAPNCKFET